MPNLVALIQVFHKHHGNFFFTKTCLRLNHLCLLRKSGAKNLEMQIQIVLETKLGENGLIYCWLVSKNCEATSRQWCGFSLIFFFNIYFSLKKNYKVTTKHRRTHSGTWEQTHGGWSSDRITSRFKAIITDHSHYWANSRVSTMNNNS